MAKLRLHMPVAAADWWYSRQLHCDCCRNHSFVIWRLVSVTWPGTKTHKCSCFLCDSRKERVAQAIFVLRYHFVWNMVVFTLRDMGRVGPFIMESITASQRQQQQPPAYRSCFSIETFVVFQWAAVWLFQRTVLVRWKTQQRLLWWDRLIKFSSGSQSFITNGRICGAENQGALIDHPS